MRSLMHLKQSLLAERPPDHKEERRRNPRQEVQGVIFLKFLKSDFRSAAIRAVLIDLSASGFRVSHTSKELCSGQEVAFCHDPGEGMAIAFWPPIVRQMLSTA